MISVILPVRNNDATGLVYAIHRQLENIAIPSEILVMDDASDEAYAYLFAEIRKLPLVKLFHSPSRRGAMPSRIELAKNARYPYLLMLDSDNLIINEHFMQEWLKVVRKNLPVVSGGTLFPDNPPAEEYILCWKYRKERETQKGLLITRNLLIRKDIFLSINFPDELLQHYGHDDTWLGIQLRKKGIRLKEIKNPCLNEGFDTAELFIKKAEQALGNLKRMRRFETAGNISAQVKLFRTAYILQQTGLAFLFKGYYAVNKKRIHKNLFSSNPSLKNFDYYRLNYLLNLKNA